MTQPLSRRDFLTRSASSALILPLSAPAIITRDHRRPKLEQGIATGDVSTSGAVVWSRADRPCQMWVEWSTYRDFRTAHRVRGPLALKKSDFTAKLGLGQLPPGQELFYRIIFEDLKTHVLSEPKTGRFRTPDLTGLWPSRFAWSGDVGGQGYGINPKIGGMTIFEAIRQSYPDVFLHCGDVIYADAPLRAKKTVESKKTWHNLLIPEKKKVAETLSEFRANFRYNLIDHNLRQMNETLPTAFTWDDHETKNNWWPGRRLSDARYSEKSCDLLSARARAAFFEYCPLAHRADAPGRIYRRLNQGPNLDIFMVDSRSYRGKNGPNREEQIGPKSAFYGIEQLAWLCRSLAESRSIWKVVVCPQPLSVLINHRGGTFEGAGNGLAGRPRGRELEIAELLSFIKRNHIKNVVFVTADVHYAAAHHYDPKRGSFKGFNPFWEFLAGPLNAGNFGPNPLDPTFGPKQVFQSIPNHLKPGTSPLSGHQFYGLGQVDSQTKRLTVSLHGQDGRELWSTELTADS